MNTDDIALFVIEQKALVHRDHPHLTEDHIKDEVMMRLARRMKELQGQVRTLELQQETDRQTIASLLRRDWSEHEDAISEAIQDSIDMDWTSAHGARAVVRYLNSLASYGTTQEI